MPTCGITPMASPAKYRQYREACFDDSPDMLTRHTDDFIIGDRIFVNGSKPGYIQYIGETQFAPGEWAGVVLDEPVGRNNGSVAGVRYFQCQPKRGIFARLHRVTRLPCTNGLTPTVNRHGDKTVVSSTRISPAAATSKSSPRSGGDGTTVTTTLTSLSGAPRIGDRVLVNATSGVKLGWLRYLGPTQFSTGNWAGVELDEPAGKNDGTVAGRKYFECRDRYGLFAPLHKVSKVPSGRNSVTITTSRVGSPSHIHLEDHSSPGSMPDPCGAAFHSSLQVPEAEPQKKQDEDLQKEEEIAFLSEVIVEMQREKDDLTTMVIGLEMEKHLLLQDTPLSRSWL